MPKTNDELIVQRADLALSQLQANGGILNPEQTDAFIDMVAEQPTLLRQARFVRMNAPERKINRIGFDRRILTAASQNGGAEDDGSNGRYVPKAKRAAPTTGQITLRTSEVIAEVRLPYEVLEDNIEGMSLEDHIIRLIAQQAAIDLEELALFGDTASSDAYLALQDGWIKRASVNVVDNAGVGCNPDLFVAGMLAMPQRYMRNLTQMRGYVSIANLIKYRQKVSARATGYGDAAMQQALDVYAQGLKVEPANMLAADGSGEKGLITFPQNLLFGIQRNVSIESDKDIRSREYIIVLTARVALQMDDNKAAVRLEDIGRIITP